MSGTARTAVKHLAHRLGACRHPAPPAAAAVPAVSGGGPVVPFPQKTTPLAAKRNVIC